MGIPIPLLIYDTHAFQQRIARGQAKNEHLDHYRLLTEHSTIQSVEQGSAPGEYTLSVQNIGTWAYQFSQTELLTIASHIAGKSHQDATNMVLHTSGVQQVLFSIDGTLPTDTHKIHFLFLVQQ